MSDARSLPEHIERIEHALTASELSKILAVSPITSAEATQRPVVSRASESAPESASIPATIAKGLRRQ